MKRPTTLRHLSPSYRPRTVGEPVAFDSSDRACPGCGFHVCSCDDYTLGGDLDDLRDAFVSSEFLSPWIARVETVGRVDAYYRIHLLPACSLSALDIERDPRLGIDLCDHDTDTGSPHSFWGGTSHSDEAYVRLVTRDACRCTSEQNDAGEWCDACEDASQRPIAYVEIGE